MENKQSGGASNLNESATIVRDQCEVVSYIYTKDVVRSKLSGAIGVVSEVADGDQRDSLHTGQIRVLWIDGTEAVQNISDLIVVDRGYLHGNLVAAASDPTGQLGIVVDVNISVDLQPLDGSIVKKDISSKLLQRVSIFTVGDFVVFGPWLGRIEKVYNNVTVLLDDGGLCEVTKAEPLLLRPTSKTTVEDDKHFFYYPGQCVRARSSSVFKNSRWLYGGWKASCCLEGTVTEVTAELMSINWLKSAPDWTDSSTQPAEEQSPQNIKLLSAFAYANWEVGDRCLLPFPSVIENRGLPHLPLHGFRKSESSASKLVSKSDEKLRMRKGNFEKALLIVNTRTKVDVSWQDGIVNHGLDATTLIPISSIGRNEFIPEQCVVEMIDEDDTSDSEEEDTSKYTRFGFVKTTSRKVRTAYIRWFKSMCSPTFTEEFDQEQMASVYELEKFTSRCFRWGGVVVREAPISQIRAEINAASFGFKGLGSDDDNDDEVSEVEKCLGDEKVKNDSSGEVFLEFSDLSWVGYIIGFKDGDIEVAWLDGNVSKVGRKGIHQVCQDDDGFGDVINKYGVKRSHGIQEQITFQKPEILAAAHHLCILSSEEPGKPTCDRDDRFSFKRFDIVKDPLDHHYRGASKENKLNKDLSKRVLKEWGNLRKDLPDGIFVRVYEDQMDILRAVIVGAYGTPYQDGLFVFDFHLPSTYPKVPPSVYYHSCGFKINPNLNKDGTICLSLLNTWSGRENEVWLSNSSSILQVLVSLQGLVLNSRPYFNEAGYDSMLGTLEGETKSLDYNEDVFLLNCKTMMHVMRKPPKDFEELVKEHFKSCGYFILKACAEYLKGYLIGCLSKNASVSDEGAANKNSEGFRLALTKTVSKLLSTFTALDVDCREYKEFPYSNEFAHLKP